MHREQIGQGEPVQGGEDMGSQTILGDVHNPAPIVVQGSGGGGNGLLTLALGAILGGGGIALGQFLSKPVVPTTPAIQQTDQDTTTTIGLGRIEDYVK